MLKKIFYSEYKGSLIPEELWQGSVQSIYSKAVNLLHPSGILISIVNSQEQLTDYGIALSNFNSFLSGVYNGCKVFWVNDHISFSNIILDIGNSSVWSGYLCESTSICDIDISKIKKIFTKMAVEDGFSPLVTKKTGNIYSIAADRLISEAVKTLDVHSGALIDLSKLIGLGIGFTPSGDDFLTGILLYEAISGCSLIDREPIRINLHRTTSGGKTLLTLALQNSFPFYLMQFSESIYTGKLPHMEAVRIALKHGSTSGSDSLSGFIWAEEARENNKILRD